VQSAMLTIFQTVVAGDSWGLIAVPVIEKEPWTALVLAVIVITVSLGVMNLILAIIVERATEAREMDHDRKRKEKLRVQRNKMLNLASICADMDSDSSGTLSLDEMLNGFSASQEAKNLFEQMDLGIEDLTTIFNVLDEDRSGDVSYLEFCQNLDGASRKDPQTLQSITRFSVAEIRILIQQEVMKSLQLHTSLLEEQTALLKSLDLKLSAFTSGEVQLQKSERGSSLRQMAAKDETDGDISTFAAQIVESTDCALMKLGYSPDAAKQLDSLDQMIQTLSELHKLSDAESSLARFRAALDGCSDELLPHEQRCGEHRHGDDNLCSLLSSMSCAINKRLADDHLVLAKKCSIQHLLCSCASQMRSEADALQSLSLQTPLYDTADTLDLPRLQAADAWDMPSSDLDSGLETEHVSVRV